MKAETFFKEIEGKSVKEIVAILREKLKNPGFDEFTKDSEIFEWYVEWTGKNFNEALRAIKELEEEEGL